MVNSRTQQQQSSLLMKAKIVLMNGSMRAFYLIWHQIQLLQTIQEQQKVIRRLLKKTNSTDSLKHFSLNGNSEENNDLTGEPFRENIFSPQLAHQLNWKEITHIVLPLLFIFLLGQIYFSLLYLENQCFWHQKIKRIHVKRW